MDWNTINLSRNNQTLGDLFCVFFPKYVYIVYECPTFASASVKWPWRIWGKSTIIYIHKNMFGPHWHAPTGLCHHDGCRYPDAKSAPCHQQSPCWFSFDSTALYKNTYIALQPLSKLYHYNDVIMGAIACQITSLTIVFSTVYLDIDQRKYQSSASLAFVRGIHRRPVNSPQMASNAENVSIWWRHHDSGEVGRSETHWFLCYCWIRFLMEITLYEKSITVF